MIAAGAPQLLLYYPLQLQLAFDTKSWKSNKRKEEWHQVVGTLVCDNMPLPRNKMLLAYSANFAFV
jgi:hypothetical protein